MRQRGEIFPETDYSLARAVREHVERVLRVAGGNISEAARLLGIHRRSLQRKMDKLQVGRPR